MDALEMQFDESSSFLDLETGRVETVSNDLLGEADESVGEEPGLPAWQKQEWETAKRIVSTDRFQQLPTKFDVHEWAIMQDFSNSVASDRVREDLLNAIHGAGAFRHFKDILRRHQIESAWFEFRAEALRQIAVDWCKRSSHPLAIVKFPRWLATGVQRARSHIQSTLPDYTRLVSYREARDTSAKSAIPRGFQKSSLSAGNGLAED